MDVEQEQYQAVEQSIYEQIADNIMTNKGEEDEHVADTIAAAGVDAAAADASPENLTIMEQIFYEIFYSPMNLCLLVIIVFLVYKIVRDRTEVPGTNDTEPTEAALPKLHRDFTVKELRAFDGTQPGGRVLVAVNGTVYDVTKGKRFYGPGGPYATFAGRDASRNLATFSVEQNNKDEYDDLTDLTAMEMDSVIEWELQFKEKYDFVGKLLRENEVPNVYDDDEEDEQEQQDPTSSAGAAVQGGLRKRTPGVQKVDVDITTTAPVPAEATTTETVDAANVVDHGIEVLNVKKVSEAKNSTEKSETDEPQSTDC